MQAHKKQHSCGLGKSAELRRFALFWQWLDRPWVHTVVIFLLSFLPRAIDPVSLTMLWYRRAIHFYDALLSWDWAATYQSYHPGVTTLWLAGIGLKLFAWQRGLSSAQLLGDAPAKPGTVDAAVSAGLMPMTLVIALCIVLAYVLLRRLAGPKIAFVGAFLLALDPFYLTYSKVLHGDALLATFMLISVLFMFNYVYHKGRWDLVLSGVFAGLAFLTKTPAFFLIPYIELFVGLYWLAGLYNRGAKTSLVPTLLVWGAVAAVVFVALWPALWVEPLDVVYWVYARTIFHIRSPHFNPVFFNGEVSLEDPGLPFYLVTLALKTTLVTLPMVCVAFVLCVGCVFKSVRGLGESPPPQSPPEGGKLALIPPKREACLAAWPIVGLLLIYVASFTVAMGLARFKQLPYLLPIFPALDVVAAFGLVPGAELLGTSWFRRLRWLPSALIALVLALQAATVLPRHPYYGTHHNILLGSSKAAQHILPMQDQAEGLDLAAQYLNMLPRAQHARAWVYKMDAEFFARDFIGFTNTEHSPWIHYRVYYLNQIMRKLDEESWREQWEADRKNPPLWSVAFDGVTYVWVYGAPPEPLVKDGVERPLDYQLGEYIRLQRVRLNTETLAPGENLVLVLDWVSDGEVKGDYTVFCHILSADGELVAQRDGPPIYGVRRTPSWRVGEVIEDSYEIFLDDDLPSGEYELSVGMYEAESMQRLPAYDADGQRLPEDRIVLGRIYVEAP